MGYRSHVSAAITAPSKDFFVSMITELKLSGQLKDEDPMFNKQSTKDWSFFRFVTMYESVANAWRGTAPDGRQREHLAIPLVTMQFVTEEDLKWYEGYDYPVLWEAMKEIAERHGLPWQFIRIGEEDSDVENANGYDSDPLREYLEVLNLIEGDTVEERDAHYRCYEAALEDGMHYFQVCTIVEDGERYEYKSDYSMRDLLCPQEVK
jgi:hypothetical protein